MRADDGRGRRLLTTYGLPTNEPIHVASEMGATTSELGPETGAPWQTAAGKGRFCLSTIPNLRVVVPGAVVWAIDEKPNRVEWVCGQSHVVWERDRPVTFIERGKNGNEATLGNF